MRPPVLFVQRRTLLDVACTVAGDDAGSLSQRICAFNAHVVSGDDTVSHNALEREYTYPDRRLAWVRAAPPLRARPGFVCSQITERVEPATKTGIHHFCLARPLAPQVCRTDDPITPAPMMTASYDLRAAMTSCTAGGRAVGGSAHRV